MFWRMIRSMVIVALAAAFVTWLPDLARYLRIREM